MRTTEYSGEGWEVTFHHNGDYGGNVVVVLPSAGAEAELSHNMISVQVPYEAMEQLVLDKLRSEQIERLESADYPELKRLLGWK